MGPMTIQPPKNHSAVGELVQTSDGSWTLKHHSHGQDFHSFEGAKFEAWQLYIEASGINQRFNASIDGVQPIEVLDVGLGLGYNAAATVAAWLNGHGCESLRLTSLEIDDNLVQELIGGNAAWCDGWDEAWLLGPRHLKNIAPDRWQALLKHPVTSETLNWEIVVGDGNAVPLTPPRPYNYIWQDPFTPELNPGMWSEAWFSKVRESSAKDAMLMTYSVSRVVKDALSAAGWVAERFPTPGKKRHWLRATPANEF